MALPNYPDASVQAFLNPVSPSVLSSHGCTKTSSAQMAAQVAPFTSTGDTLETHVLPRENGKGQRRRTGQLSQDYLQLNQANITGWSGSSGFWVTWPRATSPPLYKRTMPRANFGFLHGE